MSQRNRKYKRLEALFSEVQPATPDSPLRAPAKTPAPRTPAEDLTGRIEKTRARPSAEDAPPGSVVPPAGSRQDFLNGTDRGQKMGFSYDQGKVTSLEETPLTPAENALCVPLMVSGTTIGTIQAAGNEAGLTAQEIKIVCAVAAQLARHLANLRLPEKKEKPARE
jgi:GAF domain-containing protein